MRIHGNGRRTRGFTMAELLVAIGIGLIIMGLVTYCFHHTSMAANRALAMLDTNHKARVAMDLIRRDLESMHPGCGIDIGTKKVSFMTSIPRVNYDADDSTRYNNDSKFEGADYAYDLMWVKYEFSSEVRTGDDGTTWTVYGLKRACLEPTTGTTIYPPSASPPGAITTGAAGHTILEGIKGEFGKWNNKAPPQARDNVISVEGGIALDGSGVPQNDTERPGILTMQMRVFSESIGAGGDTVGQEFQFQVPLPWNRP